MLELRSLQTPVALEIAINMTLPPSGVARIPNPAEVVAQIERMLASPGFQQAGSLSRFLAYIVEETLAGRGEMLKEYSLGVTVFDRGETFDPKVDTIVRVQARRLRAKLEQYYQSADQRDPVLIELPKGSYAPTFQFSPVSGPPAQASRPRRFPPRLVIPAAALVILLAAVWAVGSFVLRPAVRSPFTSVAVLPFDNLAGDASEEWFSDGMTETLIMELSKIRGLKVISRTSVMPFKHGPRKSLRQIATELGVEAVVEGSALRVGDRVRITAQLILAATDTHLWANDFDGDVKDILSLQRTVARSIAQQTGSALVPAAQPLPVPAHSPDAEASQLYLRGLFQSNRGSEAGLRKGIELFEKAVARSPDYPEAYAAMASALTQLSSFYAPPNDVMPKAKAAALKALALNNELAQAHTQLGLIKLYYDWDWPGAEKELKVALDLDPNSGEAHLLYEDYLLVMGKAEQAVAEGRKSIELDPLSPRVLVEAQFAFLVLDHFKDVVKLGERIAEIEPGLGTSHAFTSLAYSAQGDFEAARREIETAVLLEPTPMNKALHVHVLAKAGDKAGALRILDELKALNAKRYICSYEVATAYVSLGDKDAAFRYLNQGLHERADCMVWLRVEPWMKSLRTDPRFDKLAGAIGLP